MILDLPAGWPEIVRALIAGPGAWASVPELAERLRIAEASADSRCRALDGAGWLSTFEFDSIDVWTFSSLAAERLQLRLEPLADSAGEKWVRGPEGPALRSKHGGPSVGIAALAVDPSPGPAEIVETAELVVREWARRGERGSIDPNRVPWPTVILTGSATTWDERYAAPGRQLTPAIHCSCCKLRPLSRSTICLRCFRWGWDHFFEAKVRRA